MPPSLPLPTTRASNFEPSLRSDSHPSLPITASIRRHEVRAVLKLHRRLVPRARPAHLMAVHAAFEAYVPFLCALDDGLGGGGRKWRMKSGGSGGGGVNDDNDKGGKEDDGEEEEEVEEIDVLLVQEVKWAWRSVVREGLSGVGVPHGSRGGGLVPGARIEGVGLDFELCFALHAWAVVSGARARVLLRPLHAGEVLTPAERTTAIVAATKLLLQAGAVHAYVAERSGEVEDAWPVTAVDVRSTTQRGLASVAMAEATLLAVLKDDPYPAVVEQLRSKTDREWMIKAPEIAKVRAHLFARLALGAAEHAGKALAAFGSSLSSSSERGSKDVAESLFRYTSNLRKTARAKACRFFAIDAELGGQTGEAIAWLRAGAKELDLKTASEEKGKLAASFSRFRKEWSEKQEDKKIGKSTEWGADAGKLEEIRIIEYLEAKWTKANDMINCQPIPPLEPLILKMPSGREIHVLESFVPPRLDAATLAAMRAPFERTDRSDHARSEDDSDDNEDNVNLPGSFPVLHVDRSSGRGIDRLIR